jgi:pyruvate/2-oxoglutarate dehydrogenase complex dihydrolipoamide acyltransferase (E2) component
VEQRLAAGEPPEALAQEVLNAWKRREISRREYLRARKLLRKAGFDWSQIDKKRRERALRKATQAKDALETVKGREAVAGFFGFEAPKEPKQKKTQKKTETATAEEKKWIVMEEAGRGWRRRVKVRREPKSYAELARQVERAKRARRGVKLLTAFL